MLHSQPSSQSCLPRCWLQVRDSIQGWVAGGSIPCAMKNIRDPHMRALLRHYDGGRGDMGRADVMPHVSALLWSGLRPLGGTPCFARRTG